jgi:hypothetical protein
MAGQSESLVLLEVSGAAAPAQKLRFDSDHQIWLASGPLQLPAIVIVSQI